MKSPRLCAECRAADPPQTAIEREEARLLTLLEAFPQYTTPVVGEYETLGVVSGTAVLGANVVRDALAGLTDFFGGRSGQYQKVLTRGRSIALAEMCDEAQKRGAELVAGITVGYETINNIMIVAAHGTALRKPQS
jgi:uncharacterized protein YbjQ (UPF0145 family)